MWRVWRVLMEDRYSVRSHGKVFNVFSVTAADASAVSSSSAYPHLSSAAIDDIEYNLSHLLNSTLGHSSLRPGNLGILPGKKAWLLNIDCIVLADTGNIYDALFLAVRAALCDTHVPVTRPVEYKTPQRDGGVGDGMDESGLDTRQSVQAADFELADYWSEGEALDGRDRWPVCVTMNLVRFYCAKLVSHTSPSQEYILSQIPLTDIVGPFS
jgi:3' exoribonuclease family, domain 1